MNVKFMNFIGFTRRNMKIYLNPSSNPTESTTNWGRMKFFFIFERFALWLSKTFYDIILNSKTVILSKIFFQSWIFEFSIFEIFELRIFWNWIWSYLSIHETQQLQQVVPRPLSTFSMYYLYLKCPLGSYLSNAPRIMSIRHIQMKRRQIKKKLQKIIQEFCFICEVMKAEGLD